MDQENLRHIAAEVIEAVAEGAGKAAVVAGKAASKIAEKAGEKAGDLSQKAVELGRTGIEVATPVVIHVAEATGEEAKKLLERTRDAAGKGKEAGMAGVATLAGLGAGALSEVEKHARASAPVVKKRGRAGRVFGWSVAAAGVASVAYLLWRRSRPIEDPWAEEYWVDLQSDVDLEDVPEEPVEWDPESVDDDPEETTEDAAE